MEINLEDDERIDDLELNNLKIIQNKNGFCFGMDSVLLSDFAKSIKNNSMVLDLGTGTGILPILLSAKTNARKIVGVEIQQDVAKMASKSILLNNLQNKIEIVCDDIKNLKNIYDHNCFDAIVTNPPYKKLDTGAINETQYKLISRHEITANLEDFISISSYLLKDKGSIYMVHRPERLVDILSTLKKYKLEPKELKFVQSTPDKAPNLVLIKAVKNSKPFLKLLNNLCIYNNDGEYTQELLNIYGKGM